MRFLFLFSFFVFFISCDENNKKEKDQKVQVKIADSAYRVPTAMSIVPELEEADSMQVIYYNDPFGADSLRYYRFFKYLAIGRSAVVDSIKTALKSPLVGTAKRECRSEGKIYIFSKGEIVKTLYFALQNDPCSYLYFMKDGNYFYFPIDENTKRLIVKLRLNAIAPKAGEFPED